MFILQLCCIGTPFIECLQDKDAALSLSNKFGHLQTCWLARRKTKRERKLAGRQTASSNTPTTNGKTKKQVEKLTKEEVAFYYQNQPLMSRYRQEDLFHHKKYIFES